MRLDLKENISFPFSDPEWTKKILLTSVYYFFSVLFLGIPMPALFGYQLACIREAANGEDEKMPEFGPGLGAMWMKGFLFSVVLFCVFILPTLGFGGLVAGGLIGVSALSESSGLVVFTIMAAAGILILFMIAIGVLMPALMLRYAMTEEVSSLFDFRAAISDMKQGPADYALIFFFPFLAGLVTSTISATGVGIILLAPLTVLTMIIQARMLGNYYRAYFH